MKRISSVLIVLLAFFTSLWGQTLTVLKTDGTVCTNDTVTININYPYEELSEHFWIANTDTASYDVQILFNILQIVPGTGYSYCWDNCYATPRDGHISGAITINGLDTNKTDFIVDYTPDGNAGITMFKFSFFAAGLADTSYLVVKFVLEQTGIHETGNSITVYPNPSHGPVNLKFPQKGEYDITVLTLTGKKVLSKRINSSFARIKLGPGVYVLNVRGETLNLVRRIVVY